MHAHEKCRKCNTCKDGIGSILACVFKITNKDWLIASFDLQTLHALSTTGWKLAFILTLCRTSRPTVGRGDEYSDQHKLNVWTRVGQSARLLGIVTRPILAVSCSSQYLMQVSSKRHARYCRFLCHVLSAMSLPGKLPWNLKLYTVYRCRSHFREARPLDCDVTIREKRWHGLVRGWNARMKVFLGKSTFNFLGDRDMIADTRRDMGENSGVRASLVTIQWQKTLPHHRRECSTCGHQWEVQSRSWILRPQSADFEQICVHMQTLYSICCQPNPRPQWLIYLK